MLGWNNNNTRRVDSSQIIKTLREMVKRVAMDFRLSSSSPLNLNEEQNDVVEAVPVSFRPPKPCTHLDMMTSQKKRVTTLLVGETLVSFQLPCNCPFGLEDIDMLAEEGRREMMYNNVAVGYRFTFFERLNGWKLERRQRVNGRFDLYYHHLQSRRVFRSITEVVNFFIYEIYPDKPVQKLAAKSKIGEDDPFGKKAKRKEKRGMPLKRKFEESKRSRTDKWEAINDLNYDEINDQIPTHKFDFDLNDDDNECQISKVDKLLAEAYDNLMKFKSFNYEENVYEEEHIVTVEEFMDEAYTNLINSKTNPLKDNMKGKEKEKGKAKKMITNMVDTKKSMDVQKTDNFISNERHKHFNIKEVNGNVVFTDIDCEPTTSRGGGGDGGSSSTMEVAQSVAFLHMDECDLINHIQESSDMFDLALFLANNRGDNGGL